MIGTLIKQFDNAADNSVKAFNKLFKIPLNYSEDSVVEIGSLSSSLSTSKRYLSIRGEKTIHIEHDFEDVFLLEQLKPATKVRTTKRNNDVYKYSAYDLDGELLETACNIPDMAEKMGTSQATIKNRLKTKINKSNNFVENTGFNITRVKL